MNESAIASSGGAAGSVEILLRCEGLALFLAACAFYGVLGGSWWLLVVLFLAPDLSFLAYLIGARAGAIVYNTVHTTIVPFILFGIGAILSMPLKYEAGFGFTHLDRIGRASR
jgi:hypothetical protein